ncbi:DEAD/DEAH box helicase [Devosia sp. 2618]|uniref:DEAD/DEAH box helicase n=1 Tax=Devosia sp. 2618 TaxID=3156454 RepID=UPI0033937B51
MRALYDHQTEAVRMLRQSLASGHKRPMLQAPTGFGKTLTAAAIVQMALDKGKRVCFTVPAISLIDQTYEEFRAEGINDIGVIQADHPWTDWMARVQVASVQTLSRRALPDTDLVLVDEAHQAFKIIFRWMADKTKLPFVGLSATPWTKGLGKHYDDLIIAATTSDLIERRFLAPFRAFAPSHPDLSGVRTVAGDFDEGQLAEAMDKPQLTADIVSTWLKSGENRPTLCFAVNRAHARKLEDEFRAAGVSTAYIDANTERDDRTKIGEAFAAGLAKVVVNVGVLTTGIDWDVRCIVLARPTKSEILYTQIIGRGLRTAEGKSDCIILDHSDTTQTLGYVTDIKHEKLDAGRMATAAKADRKPQPIKVPKECTSCHFLKPAGVHTCPECGFAPERREDIATADGELFQVKGGKGKDDLQTKQRFWSGLLWYCDQRGYSEGWASHKFKERFGVWPRGLQGQAAQPDIHCRNYVRSSQIRYAKAKDKAQKSGGAPNAA